MNTPIQSTLSATATQPCTTTLPRLVELQPPLPTPLVEVQPLRPIPLVHVGQPVCTTVAQTQLMHNPVYNIVGHTPQASTLASGVTAPLPRNVHVHTQVAHIATGIVMHNSH